MSEAETTADGESEYEARPWALMSPESRISGVPKELIYSGDLTADRNDPSFGLVLEDAEVVRGTLFVNEAKPSDATTDELSEDHPRPSDYRIADPDDRDTTVVKGSFVSDEEGPNTYEEADGFAEDEILVWFSGMSGSRLARALDFNGRPFARWTDEGYLIKGLYQATDQWRNEPQNRSDLVSDGHPTPRTARLPILRTRVETEYDSDGDAESVTLHEEPADERILIDVTRYKGGRGYEMHVFDASAFAEEHGIATPVDELERNEYYQLQTDTELEPEYHPLADDVLQQAADAIDNSSVQVPADLMVMAEGGPWGEKPANAETGSESTSFDVEPDNGGGDDSISLEEQEQAFAQQVAEAMPDGRDPSETYEGGIEGLVERNLDRFAEEPDIDRIRRLVHEQVAWLDVDEIDS